MEMQHVPARKEVDLGSILSMFGVLAVLFVSFSAGIRYLRHTEGLLIGPRDVALMIAGGFLLLVGRVLHSRARMGRTL